LLIGISHQHVLSYISFYIYANNVSGAKKGIYRYRLNTHSLYPINEHFDTSKFLQYGNFDFDNFNFLVMYEYDINKNYLKYGGLSLLNVFCGSRNYFRYACHRILLQVLLPRATFDTVCRILRQSWERMTGLQIQSQ